MQKEFLAKDNRKGMELLVDNGIVSKNKSQTKVINGEKSIKVDISIKSVLIVLAVIAAIYFAPKLLTILVLLFFAFILSSAALPLVRKLMRKGISKNWSVFIVYFFGILIFIGALTLIFVPFITESQKLLTNITGIADNFVKSLNTLTIFGKTIEVESLKGYLGDIVTWLTKTVTSAPSTQGVKSVWGALTSVAGGAVAAVTTILISIYIVVDHDNFVDIVLLRIIDESKRKRVKQLFFDVEEKLGNWLVGQLIVCFIIGFLEWLLLTILRVPFALPLAVFGALLESIPSFGPAVAAVLMSIVSIITRGLWPTVGILVGFVIISQLESLLIVPKVMANAVGLKKIVVVIAVVSGFILAGPIGGLLSIPIAVLLEIFYEFYIDLKKLEAKGNV
jgi:predicted PurR-regulated permease PerM